MTQIDFYILAENSHRNVNQMVCRLCEKATAQDMNVLLYTKSAQQAQELDDLLWTFKADSFIPHQNLNNPIPSKGNFDYPVLISSADQASAQGIPEQYQQLLINMTTDAPPFYQQFTRLAEMVGKDSIEKDAARNRYQRYRQQGHKLNKFDL